MNLLEMANQMEQVCHDIAIIGGRCSFKLDRYHADQLYVTITDNRNKEVKQSDYITLHLQIKGTVIVFNKLSMKFRFICAYMEAPIYTHYRRKYDFTHSIWDKILSNRTSFLSNL
jgi:hypothetical protein